MARHFKHTHNNSGTIPEKNVRWDFEDDLLLNNEESALSGMISDYMKGRFDLEDVSNDPGLPGMENIVDNMKLDYHKKRRRNKDNEKFIRDVFTGITADEIGNIKNEISKSNVSEITEEWVKEWNEKSNRNEDRKKEKAEIRDFITSSLESDKSKPELRATSEGKKRLSRYIIPFTSLSSAAIISAFILIRTLLPSYNQEKLFNSFYEPYNVVLPITRSVNSDKANSFRSAKENYKLGNYQSAEKGFSDEMLKDNLATEPRFYLGITYIALKNYDQAINLLSDVTILSGENGKEARWYLGLAYIMTDENEKAFACFNLLTQTPGFYHKRAEKILRRLK